jgi:hypothetical protein
MFRNAALALSALLMGGAADAAMFNKAMDAAMTIPADSALGQEVMAASSPVATDGSNRQLDNDYYNTWMVNYSLVFDKCYNLPYLGEEGGQNENGGWDSPATKQMVITYKLCDSTACGSSCKGGEYMVLAEEFVQYYLTAQMEAQEATCELASETCEYKCEYGTVYNDNLSSYYWSDDQYCMNQCYENVGLNYCKEAVDGEQEELDPLDYMECAEVENNANGGNYYGKVYYMGIACANGGSEVRLQMYSDETCSTSVSNDIFSSLNYYGTTSEYFSQSLVTSDCVSCKEQADDNGEENYYDNADADNVAEVCERLYEESGHCESNLSGVVTYPKSDSCTFIQSTLPAISNAVSGGSSRRNRSSSSNGGGGSKAAVAFAWIFGLSTCALGYYVYFLIKKIKNSTKLSSLDHQGGTVA